MRSFIRMTTLAFAIFPLASGCSLPAKNTDELNSEAISHELNRRVIDCTLPFLTSHALEKAEVAYRYESGTVTFRSDSPALSAHLEQCASPSTGPAGTFERDIEIWTTTNN